MLRTNLYKILQIAASPIWSPHNTCLWIVVLEKTPESPLDSKEIKPVNPKGNQPWILTGRTNAEAAILWPPNVKSQLTGKDPDAGKDQGQQEKGWQWMRWLDGIIDLIRHEFEQTPGDSEGQARLVCCSAWGYRVRHDWVTDHSGIT